jgi:hypothetical protein
MINQVTFGGQVTRLTPGDNIGLVTIIQTSEYTYQGEKKEKKLFMDVRCTNSVFQRLMPNQEVLVIGRLESYKSGESWKTSIFATDIFVKNSTAVITKISLEDESDTEDVPF